MTPLPEQMALLPTDSAGRPVPWFATWIEGKPDFRLADPRKLRIATEHGLCWVCGRPLMAYKAFVVGPMCVANMLSAEPPSHEPCALWSILNCPFLLNPGKIRRPVSDEIDAHSPGGIMLERNPGVSALVVTKSYLVTDEHGGILVRMGAPVRVGWWKEGRAATRDEIVASLDEGYAAAIAETSMPEPAAAKFAALIGVTKERWVSVP